MRPRALTFAIALLGLTLLSSSLLARPEPPVIAPTDALSPEDERKAFTVPAGFEVQLVACEPDIQKPIQMAFDARGRLWVTTSYHYPFAAPAGQAHDKLYILSDFEPATGKARKVEVFADDLNIPIGILPLPDCRSCIVSSVGEIRKYTDTQGTGKADKMEVLFTGFGSRDTHGMYNSYTYMPDGWVYACHGYSNASRVKGKDGHEVEMQSGNTFRFRPDGSRIEVYTRGQVNPFGIAVDPWFNLYTADCHSKPITQLIPGAYYDSFGKPHDGLGYAPHVVHHDHGSTALCGLTWYDADQFPKDYLGTMFLGNVVTNRINFDKIEWKGATPVGIEQPDFLVSKDPWFRPVDIKLAPDGTLYVSDFYNKIIGHYEVDLKHPLRDKNRGRIWRIVWKGKDGMAPAPKAPYADLTAESDDKLGKLIASPNMTVRLQAARQIIERIKSGRLEVLESITQAIYESSKAAWLYPWIVYHTGAIDNPTEVLLYSYAFIKGGNKDLGMVPLWLQTLSARDKLSPEYHKMFSDWLRRIAELYNPPNPGKVDRSEPYPVSEWVRLLVNVATFHPHADEVAPLIQILKKCPADDTHLRQAAQIALRNCLRDDDKAWPGVENAAAAKALDPIYVEMAIAIPNRRAATFLLKLLEERAIPADRLPTVAEQIGRNIPTDEVNPAIQLLTKADYSPAVGDALIGYLRALQSRGIQLDDARKSQVVQLVSKQLAAPVPPNQPLDADNVKRLLSVTRLLASLPGLMNGWDEAKLPSETVNAVGALLMQTNGPADLRLAAAEALLKAMPQRGFPIVRQANGDKALPSGVREKLAVLMAASSLKEARLDAREALKDAPYRLAVAIGVALAGMPAGAEELLDSVKQGKAPARLLQERGILERLRGARLPDLDKRVAELTKGLAAPDQRIADLLKQRAKGFVSARPDKELGAKLFAKHCGACHRIADQGGKIAPQLDGIGMRGLERLLEDVLDPNRNVDQAFRARVITTKDDRTITGLMLRVEGEVLIIADSEGKELRIPTKDIEANRETMLSPMPANFGDVIPEADLYHLMGFLLDQKAKEPAKK